MIRKLLIILISLVSVTVSAQDLPMFSQKLTNSFFYNPSLTGKGKGSVTLSNRSYYGNVPGAPKTHFLSVHTPFGMQKFGVGANLISEKIGVLDNLYASGAFAYHLNFSDEASLSFGVSSEYTRLKMNQARVDVLSPEDPLLTGFEQSSSVDFSFGTSFKTPYFEIGLSSNRLATAFEIADFETQITQFYTGYISGNLRLSEDHTFEPYFIYRKLTLLSNQWDVGGYYSFKDAVILGAAYRSGGILYPTFGVKLANKFLLGYSFEMFGSGIQRNISNSNEITLRYDFRDDSYNRNTRNSGAVMRNSVAFRRKTLSTNSIRSKPISASSQKYKKKLQRNYMKSPSYRMNNSGKLNTTKRNSKKGKAVSHKTLSPNKGKIKSKRKKNYKKYNTNKSNKRKPTNKKRRR